MGVEQLHNHDRRTQETIEHHNEIPEETQDLWLEIIIRQTKVKKKIHRTRR